MKTRGKLTVTCVVICLMVLIIVSFNAKAQSSEAISINPGGSVFGTNLIQREGDIYRLTGNINDSPITVSCSNIVLDGEGYTLQGKGGWGTPGLAGAENTAAIHLLCSNVTVQNFNISGWEAGVSGACIGNSVIDNNISRTENAVAIYAENYVVTGNILAKSIYAVYIKANSATVSQNQIINNYGGALIYPSLGNIIKENNFTNNSVDFTIGNYEALSYEIYLNNFAVDANTTIVETNSDAMGPADKGTLPSWDNGSVGNYWSDYSAKYPNAAETSNLGVGDTPYVIKQNPTILDGFPLIVPVDTTHVPPTSLNITYVPPTSLPQTQMLSLGQRNSVLETLLVISFLITLVTSVAVLGYRNKPLCRRKKEETVI